MSSPEQNYFSRYAMRYPVKKEPLIKTAKSFGIKPTFGLHLSIEKNCNGLNPISNKQTNPENINIDDSEDDEIDDVEPASGLPMGLLYSQNSLEPRSNKRGPIPLAPQKTRALPE